MIGIKSHRFQKPKQKYMGIFEAEFSVDVMASGVVLVGIIPAGRERSK